MKKTIIIIGIIFISQITFSQSDTLYLMLDNPNFRKNYNEIFIGFGIKSNDKQFNLDYFNFKVSNYKGWDKEGNDIYLDISELKQEVAIDTIDYETRLDLSKNKKWWQIHNMLSLKKKIYLVEKRNGKFNLKIKEYNIKYFIIPLVYLGTRKNFVPTDLSMKRKK